MRVRKASFRIPELGSGRVYPVKKDSAAGGSAGIGENLPAVWQAGLRPN